MSADIAAALYTNDAVASKYYCSKLAHDAQDSGPFQSRDFSGISAVAISASSWEFDTTSAHFTISAFLTSNNTQSTNASLYRGVLDNILNSIQMKNTKPLVC
jgi:hypothetical protein